MRNNISVALDLDKSIAIYESKWKAQKVGEPIPLMVENVKKWLSRGYKVTIFTARLDRLNNSEDYNNQVAMITKFLSDAGLPNLSKTCIKLREFTHFIDDKAYHCVPNTGVIKDCPEELL